MSTLPPTERYRPPIPPQGVLQVVGGALTATEQVWLDSQKLA